MEPENTQWVERTWAPRRKYKSVTVRRFAARHFTIVGSPKNARHYDETVILDREDALRVADALYELLRS